MLGNFGIVIATLSIWIASSGSHGYTGTGEACVFRDDPPPFLHHKKIARPYVKVRRLAAKANASPKNAFRLEIFSILTVGYTVVWGVETSTGGTIFSGGTYTSIKRERLPSDDWNEVLNGVKASSVWIDTAMVEDGGIYLVSLCIDGEVSHHKYSPHVECEDDDRNIVCQIQSLYRR